MEDAMPIGEVMVLGFIIAAFMTFVATLGWASYIDRPARERTTSPRQVHFGAGLRHSH